MTEPDAFPPGHGLDALGMERNGSAREGDCVVVAYPHRVHVSPVDCNRFGFGQPGGAGVGFAVDVRGELSLAVSGEEPHRLGNASNPIVEHFLALASSLAHWDGGFSYSHRLPPEVTAHCGLGSHSCLATATMMAASELLGLGLSHDEIRRLVGANFVEQVGRTLSHGLETGVGPLAVLEGGFVLLGDRVCRLDVCHELDGCSVALVWPSACRPDQDRPESLEMLRRSLRLDAEYAATRAYRLMMDFWPAIQVGNTQAAGDVVWDFQFSGTHQSMIQSYDDGGLAIYSAITALRAAGLKMVGMSSVGPMLYALGDDAASLASAVSQLGLRYTVTQVAGPGVTVRTE